MPPETTTNKSKPRVLIGGVVTLSLLTALIMIAAVAIWDDEPYFAPGIGVPALTAKYPSRVYMQALEFQSGEHRGMLMVHTVGIGVEMPSDRSGPLSISHECELSLMINDKTHNASSLTEELFTSLGADRHESTYDKRPYYHLVDKRMSVIIDFEHGRPVRLEAGINPHSPIIEATEVESLGISWQNKEVKVLPMSYSESLEYFGKPVSVDKRREM
jgi:hypothetical protein